MKQKIRAYVLTRPDCPGWMFAGVNRHELANTLVAELDPDDELSAQEFGGIYIETREFTQDEIDNMPEFPGW